MSSEPFGSGPRIERLRVSAYTIPTDAPEADGTLEWSETTLVLVELSAADRRGVGFTYADKAAGTLIDGKLRSVVEGHDAFAINHLWQEMRRSLRNVGRPGTGSMAISAIDLAAWDLKARLLGVSLARLLGPVRSEVPIYGSGGFTSYSPRQLQQQLAGWVDQGIPRVKMKIGASPADDPARVHAARKAIGPDVRLFVDANGALSRKEALLLSVRLAEENVVWFEEPVSAQDIDGLRLLRDRVPAGMEIAAGEYTSEPVATRQMLTAVDVLQADVTRCEGVTGFLRIASLCEASEVPFSSHTAPAMHLHVGTAAPMLRHLEYFHDHVRIERMLFEGVAAPREGALRPDYGCPGHGLTFKAADAARFAV